MTQNEVKVGLVTPISDEDIKNILTGTVVTWKRTGLRYTVFTNCRIERSRKYDPYKEGIVIMGYDNFGKMCVHAVSNNIFRREFTIIKNGKTNT